VRVQRQEEGGCGYRDRKREGAGTETGRGRVRVQRERYLPSGVWLRSALEARNGAGEMHRIWVVIRVRSDGFEGRRWGEGLSLPGRRQ
jgi:hypothetical protein